MYEGARRVDTHNKCLMTAAVEQSRYFADQVVVDAEFSASDAEYRLPSALRLEAA